MFIHVCVFCVCVDVSLLNDNRVEVSEAHDDIHGDRGAQVISIQTQVPEVDEQAFIAGHYNDSCPLNFISS